MSTLKQINTILTVLLIFGVSFLTAQTNQSNSIIVKGIEEIAQERHPNLFLPQDEFETNAEYSKRVARQKALLKDIRAQLLTEVEARKKEKGRLAAERAAEEERLLQIKIAESLSPAEFTPSALGRYDAENGTFPFKINGKPYTVNVPRSEARDFKKEFSSVRVEGYKQLQRDLRTYDYFNMVAIHPITGSRFAFGPTKDLAAAPVIAGKKINCSAGPYYAGGVCGAQRQRLFGCGRKGESESVHFQQRSGLRHGCFCKTKCGNIKQGHFR